MSRWKGQLDPRSSEWALRPLSFSEEPRPGREGERIDPWRGYAFMKLNRATFPLAAMCRVLGLSPSGYYGWLRRPPSARARRDAELKSRIVAKWIESGETYGAPRIHAALLAEGERVGRKRVTRLMSELDIEGVTRRRFKTGTTKRDARARPAPELVNRDFSAERPDQLWVADITYVRTWAGWHPAAGSSRRPGVGHQGLGEHPAPRGFDLTTGRDHVGKGLDRDRAGQLKLHARRAGGPPQRVFHLARRRPSPQDRVAQGDQDGAHLLDHA